MATKLLKYGLGIIAPEIPTATGVPSFRTVVHKQGTMEIAAAADAGEIRLAYADGTTEYVIAMGEGSRASFVAAPPSGRAVSVTLKLGANAAAIWKESCTGAFVREQVVVTLAGGGASYEAHLAFRGTGTDVIDLRHEIMHAAPHTTSNLVVRGVLEGKAKAFARGLVRIPKGMVGCVGRQREEFLMLSGKPEVAVMPDLEIACHEVQCGHAASIGRIDSEKIHYFASRGISREEATEMIVEGFLKV